MAFETFVEAGPHCAGDSVRVYFCNCPENNVIGIRMISPSPSVPVNYTPFDGGVEIDGTDVGSFQYEIKCCVRLEQDPDNPYIAVSS